MSSIAAPSAASIPPSKDQSLVRQARAKMTKAATKLATDKAGQAGEDTLRADQQALRSATAAAIKAEGKLKSSQAAHPGVSLKA